MKGRATAARARLEPEERRRQLVGVAAGLLSRGGIEALQFTELAAAAGVTRPVVYKFFATREALVRAILDDFEAELTRRFAAAAVEATASSLEEATRVFIDAICDAIDTSSASSTGFRYPVCASKGSGAVPSATRCPSARRFAATRAECGFEVPSAAAPDAHCSTDTPWPGASI